MSKFQLILSSTLAALIATSPVFAAGKSAGRTFTSPFQIHVPPQWGEITRFYKSPRSSTLRPDFILIQDVHSNQYVQQGISQILTQLNNQRLLPANIAVEGAVGAVPYQNSADASVRQRMANLFLEEGKITGAAHYVIHQGKGSLYGVENKHLYRTSIDMFRRSHAARAEISRELDKLEAALNLLKTDSVIPVSVSLLRQDIQAVRKLLGQQLVPSETHEAINHALLAADHLRQVLPTNHTRALLQAVSSSVNFYALALMRDEALFNEALDLRLRQAHKTTVIVAGGFHTPGLTQRMRAQGFSYVVITPKIKMQNIAGERQYVARVLGQPISTREASRNVIAAMPIQINDPYYSELKKSEIVNLAAKLGRKLSMIEFENTPRPDLLAALDSPGLHPSIRGSLAQQRSRIFAPALTDARDTAEARVF